MANCPNCGSEHIQLTKNTNVDWGRAVAGWALFGVVGGAVGAVTGEDRNANTLDCGTSWKAADLYKTQEVIKSLTGKNLNLASPRDRNYINSFMIEISPHIEAISRIEQENKNKIKNLESKSDENAAAGCGYGCLTSIIVIFAIASFASGSGIFIALIFPPLIGCGIGTFLDKTFKNSLNQEIAQLHRQSEKMKIEAEENLKEKVIEFSSKFGSDF